MIFDESSFDLGEQFLAHYGKKGMHWGIRKALPNGGANFWANAATRTVAKGKKPTSPYLGVAGGYGRAVGLGLKKHPAFAVAGGAAIAALIAGSIFAAHRKRKVNTIPAAPTTKIGGLFIQSNLSVNNQQLPLGAIQNYQLWPHNQLRELGA